MAGLHFLILSRSSTEAILMTFDEFSLALTDFRWDFRHYSQLLRKNVGINPEMLHLICQLHNSSTEPFSFIYFLPKLRQ
jgi:hypothetical protein